jgi:Trypsin-co-occurring domain 1
MPVVQLKTSSNTDIYIEVAEISPAINVQAIPENVLDTFEKVGQSIADVCSDVFAKVNLNELSPDELTLEFSLSIGTDLSIPFIAKSSGEGTFTVKALWKKPEKARGRR